MVSRTRLEPDQGLGPQGPLHRSGEGLALSGRDQASGLKFGGGLQGWPGAHGCTLQSNRATADLDQHAGDEADGGGEAGHPLSNPARAGLCKG